MIQCIKGDVGGYKTKKFLTVDELIQNIKDKGIKVTNEKNLKTY